MCGFHLSRTTTHHRAANGLAKRIHRKLKAAIMCRADELWTDALPLDPRGIRNAYKEDLQSSAAELVYGEPLRVPFDLLSAATKVELSVFIHEFRRHMNQLRPTPAERHSSPATFFQMDLRDLTHVLQSQEAIRRALEPP
jgi:hypothetical protein